VRHPCLTDVKRASWRRPLNGCQAGVVAAQIRVKPGVVATSAARGESPIAADVVATPAFIDDLKKKEDIKVTAFRRGTAVLQESASQKQQRPEETALTALTAPTAPTARPPLEPPWLLACLREAGLDQADAARVERWAAEGNRLPGRDPLIALLHLILVGCEKNAREKLAVGATCIQDLAEWVAYRFDNGFWAKGERTRGLAEKLADKHRSRSGEAPCARSEGRQQGFQAPGVPNEPSGQTTGPERAAAVP